MVIKKMSEMMDTSTKLEVTRDNVDNLDHPTLAPTPPPKELSSSFIQQDLEKVPEVSYY